MRRLLAELGWPRLRSLLLAVFAFCSVVLVLYVSGAFTRFQTRAMGPPTIRARLNEVQIACLNYYYQEDILPWDERGEEAALYKLKPWTFDPRTGAGDWFDAPMDAEQDVTGPAWFDQATERLLGGDVEYLNQPSVNWDRHVVLLAEQWWVRQQWRWFVTADGYIGRWPVPQPGNKTRLVGRTYNPDTGTVLPDKAPTKGSPPKAE